MIRSDDSHRQWESWSRWYFICSVLLSKRPKYFNNNLFRTTWNLHFCDHALSGWRSPPISIRDTTKTIGIFRPSIVFYLEIYFEFSVILLSYDPGKKSIDSNWLVFSHVIKIWVKLTYKRNLNYFLEIYHIVLEHRFKEDWFQ